MRILATMFTLMIVLGGCDRNRPVAMPQEFAGTIVALGDSLTAGYGVKLEEAYPAVLEKRLWAKGHPWRVINAGVSGDTSADLLARLEKALEEEPDIAILAIGPNDALRGVSPAITRGNLEKIMAVLDERKITTVVVGTEANVLGHDFLKGIVNIQRDVAKAYDAPFVPSMLRGVAGRKKLNQSDAMHPNAKGYLIVAENVLPKVIEAIEGR